VTEAHDAKQSADSKIAAVRGSGSSGCGGLFGGGGGWVGLMQQQQRYWQRHLPARWVH